MADGRVVIDTKLDKTGLETGLKSLKGILSAGIASLGLATLSKVVGEIAQETTALNDSVRKASTLFGNVAVDTEMLTSKMNNLAMATGVSSSQIGEALYNALSAGIPATEDMNEALGFIEKSIKTSQAGFADLAETVTATASVLNAYGLSASEADRIQGILIQTQNKGITTVGELASTLAQVVPTASAYGVSFEQVGSALATMTAQGTKTAQATTSLNAMLAELGKNGQVASKNLAKASESAGMGAKTFNDLISEGYTLSDILNLMQDYAEANGLNLVDMFGSIEAGRGALQLASEDGENFNTVLESMSDTAGLVDESFNKVLTNTDRLKATFNELKTIIGNQFAGSLDKVAGGMADLLQNIINSGKEATLLQGEFANLTKAIDDYRKAQEEAEKATGNLSEAISTQSKQALNLAMYQSMDAYEEASDSIKKLVEENENLESKIASAFNEVEEKAKDYGVQLERIAELSETGNYQKGTELSGIIRLYDKASSNVLKWNEQMLENNAIIEESTSYMSEYIASLTYLYSEGVIDINLYKMANEDLYDVLMSFDAGTKSATENLLLNGQTVDELSKSLATYTEMMDRAKDAQSWAKWAGYVDVYSKALDEAKSKMNALDSGATSSPAPSAVSAPSGDKYVYAYDPSKIKGNIDEAIGVYSDLRAELKAIATMEELLGDEYDSSEAKASAYRNALEALARAGLDPTQTSVQNLLEEYEKLGKETDELIKKDNVINSVTNVLSSSLQSLSDGIGNISKRTQELQSNLDSVNRDITEAEEDKLELEEEILDAQARGDDEAEKRAKKRKEEIEEQIAGYKDLKKTIEDEQKAVESGAEAWNMMGRTALLALAEILDALGHELTARAVTSLLSGNFAGSAMAIAGATTAYLASGGIKNKANSFADGGIVQQQAGVSPVGDNHVAFVNAGELILNQAQQANLADQIRAMSEALNNRGGGIYISMNGAYIYGLDEPAVGRAIHDNIESLRAEGVL